MDDALGEQVIGNGWLACPGQGKFSPACSVSFGRPPWN